MTSLVPDFAQADLASHNLALDLGGVESRLQSVNNATSLWSLPALPDTVKLDIATHPAFAQSAPSDFLHGLDADIAAVTAKPAPRVDTTALLNPSQTNVEQSLNQQQAKLPQNMLFMPDDDFTATFQKAVTQLAGISAPKRIDNTSVIDLKSKAVARGLIPADTPLDGTWGGQWNGVRSDLMNAEFRDVLSGDRPGGEPIGSAVNNTGVMGLMNKWMSPTGLISLGVGLDFVPDVKQIANETSHWGDKWRKWWGDKSSPRAFIDALTGPIDDVAFPIINTALLFTGAGEVVTFARGLSMSAEALSIASKADAAITAFGGVRDIVGVSRASRVLGMSTRAVEISDEIAHMQKASTIAARLSKSSTGVVSGAGDVLAAWRQQTSVTMMKKLVQTGMKVGFAGRVEELLTPDRQLGIGLAGQTGGTAAQRGATFQEWANAKVTNPWAMGAYGLFETALTPTSIFKPGSFVGPLRSGTTKLASIVTSLPADRKLGVAFGTIGIARLAQDDAPLAAKLSGALSTGKSKEAMAVLFGGAKDLDLVAPEHLERAGQVMAYATYTAGIDSYARKEAYATLGYTSGPQYERVFNGYRNQAINQMRGAALDLETEGGRNAWRAWYSKIAAMDEAPTASQFRRKELWDASDAINDPAHADHAHWRQLAEDSLAHHDQVRQGTWTEIMDAAGTPEDLASTIDAMWPTLASWDQFDSSIRQLGEHTAFTAPGNATLREVRDLRTGDFAHSSLAEDIAKLKSHPEWKKVPEWFDNTKVQMAEGRGRLTVARLDGGRATAQEAEAYAAQVRIVQSMQTELTKGADGVFWQRYGGSLQDWAQRRNKLVEKLTPRDIKAWTREVKALPAEGSALGSVGQAEGWANAVVWASKQGLDISDHQALIHMANQRVAELDDNAEFWSRAGVSAWQNGAHATLDEKMQLLRRRVEFMAKEVAVDPALEARLRNQGYRVVFGTEFATPHDVMDLAGPMPEVRRGDLARRSLGVFIGHDRGVADLQHDLRDERARRLVPGVLEDLRKAGHTDLGGWGSSFAGQADVESFMSMLYNANRTNLGMADETTKLYEQAGMLSSVLGKAANSGIPHSIYRLNIKQLREVFGTGFNDRALKAIRGALLEAENTGWENRGLLSLEDHFVSRSWARGVLKGFSAHPVSTDFTEWAKGLDTIGQGPLQTASAVVEHPLLAGRKYISAVRESQTGARRAFQAALGGALGAYGSVLANDKGADVNPLAAAAAGATAGGVWGVRNVINPLNVTRAFAAYEAQQAAVGQGGGGVAQGLAAVGGGLFAGAVAKGGARAGVHFLDDHGWASYSRLGTTARATRDRVRFSLNPIWDAQRYTEGAMQGAIADLPQGVTLPITARPMARYLTDARKAGNELVYTGSDGIQATGKAAVLARYKAAAKGSYDFSTLDAMQGWFTDRGIMGFSPTDLHAATFSRLVDQGMNESAAVKAVNQMYMHGLRRSGLESSVNFVFFPFSFQKHLIGNTARFLADDVSRVTMLHDSMKVWDTLNARYDLPQMWRDHLPILDELRKFNPIAYGISPGEFGGVNRANYEALKRMPGLSDAHDAIANAFLPQAWEVKTPDDWHTLRPKMQRLIPIWREAEDLFGQTMQEQANVIASPTHLSTKSEIEAGWNANAALNDSMNQTLAKNNLTFAKVMSASDTTNTELMPLKQAIYQARYALEDKYPAWRKDKIAVGVRTQERDRELAKIINDPHDNVDMATVNFDHALKQLTAQFGFNVKTDVEQLTSQQFDAIRNYAISLAREAPGFQTNYRVYYQRLFGPIERGI